MSKQQATKPQDYSRYTPADKKRLEELEARMAPFFGRYYAPDSPEIADYKKLVDEYNKIGPQPTNAPDRIEQLLSEIRSLQVYAAGSAGYTVRRETEPLREYYRRARRLGVATGLLPSFPTGETKPNDEFEAYLIQLESALEEAAAVPKPSAATPKSLTVLEIVRRWDVSKPTVTRWAKEADQPKPKGEYAIPESAIPPEWPPRSTSAPKPHRPALAKPVVWECVSCEAEVTSPTRPQKCDKCNRPAFARKNLNPAAK